MKILFLTLLLISSPFARAEDVPGAQLLSVSGKAVPPPVMSVIGGRKATLAFHLPAGISAVTVDLFQVAGGVAAPLAKALPLKGKDEAVLDLDIPAVNRQTELLLILHGRADGTARKLGQFRLVAFPADFAAEWVKFARQLEDERGLGLGVFGEAAALRDFLQTAGVAFSDLGAGIPSSLPHRTVVLGVVGENSRDRATQFYSTDVPGVLLISDATGLPGVYPQAGSRLTVITLSLLDGFAGDPRAQQTLLETLRPIVTSLKRP
jgi:hypothetical protein